MRIRRRATVTLPQAQAPSSPSPQRRSPPASPPPSSPTRAPAPHSGIVAARWAEPRARKVDPSMCDETLFDPRRGNRQEEEKREHDKASRNEKRGGEDGGSEREDGRPVHVVCRFLNTPAAPKREEEERRREVQEQKSEESGRAKDEERAAEAAMCKRADGKGWRCKRVAQFGYSLCQYHLDKHRSYGCYSQKKTKNKKKKPNMAAPVSEKSAAAPEVHRQEASQPPKNKNKRRRMEEYALGTGLGASDSFYYYSGFGPWWGKRRGNNRSVDGVKAVDSLLHRDMGDAAAAAATAGEEEEGEYDFDSSGRDGRPTKSRPLSSL